MSIFLFIKQFVDMLYKWQWLDIAMVLLAFCMLGYQYLLVRPNLKKEFRPADAVVAALALLSTVSFIRDVTAYQAYIKVMSAFLLYFMGRLYYDRVLECDDALALSSYLIIYINFIHRIVTFGSHFLQVKNANGDLYYYDTDLAYAVVLAFIFIAMFARNSIFKFITIFLVCLYMVICSDAGIQTILLAVIAVVLLMYVLEVALKKKKLAMAGLGIIILALMAAVVLIYVPLLTADTSGTWTIFGGNTVLDVANMESRYAQWQQVFAIRRPETLLEILFGISFNTHLPLMSFYLKLLYTLGIVGAVLVILLMLQVFKAAYKGEDRKSFYITVMVAILMLGSGVTFNTMESLQMSWFMMLFAGMVISAEGRE
ncbi:hypothetical protein [Butyrivibrio sp. AE2015]|uniref:hypothetical protein n=1 Tax=Butyrivibrio sp. AE2015 TaxID=1280663 RepID=UPI0003B4D287|nr:hypothetical protein [Butyrivibrio sp. AE2015]